MPLDPAVATGALAALGYAPATAFPWLSVSILMPIAAALLIPFIPDPGDGKTIRWYALGVALVTFLVTAGAYINGYDPYRPIDPLKYLEAKTMVIEYGDAVNEDTGRFGAYDELMRRLIADKAAREAAAADAAE